jgi:hypothetical protein
MGQIENLLNNLEIPDAPKFEKSFLGIAKQPHYENVISNIYAFFLNISEDHKLGDLFIKSLLELIKDNCEKDFESFLKDFNIYTEYPVKYKDNVDDTNGRIDILLENHDGAIIIENKIYHYLNNPLKAYWDEINKPEENKIGIVLSLNTLEIKNKDFINITHKDFIERVQFNFMKKSAKGKNKYIVFFEDFCQNILNLSNEIMNEQDLNAFNDKRKEIIEVSNYLNRVKQHVENQVELALKNLEKETKSRYVKPLNSINKDRLRFLQKNDNLMITVVYDDVFDAEKDNEIYIIIEVHDKDVSPLIRDFKKSDKYNFYENDFEKWKSDDGRIVHVVSKKYNINTEKLANLRYFILDKLKNDSFIDLFAELSEKI